jgi:hypothetical protein
VIFQWVTADSSKKIAPSASPMVVCAAPRALHLSPLDNPDFHQENYTEGLRRAKDLLAATGMRSRKV